MIGASFHSKLVCYMYNDNWSIAQLSIETPYITVPLVTGKNKCNVHSGHRRCKLTSIPYLLLVLLLVLLVVQYKVEHLINCHYTYNILV